MLSSTFVHLPGVGPVTERALWEAGITSWQQFVDSPSLPGRLRSRQQELAGTIGQCLDRLASADAAYFNACLPAKERWRLYPEFRDRAAFLDIETTGLSPDYAEITVVGILDSEGYRAFIQGENLEDTRAALEGYSLVVTYNGAAFDLPFMEHHFGTLFRGMAHLDLRFPLRRLGYRGGLKAIEEELGFARDSELAGLSGYDAVLLWRMWENGDAGALDTLVSYNAEDVASLVPLADFVYNNLADQLPLEQPPLKPLPRPTLGLHYDDDVLRRLRAMHLGPGLATDGLSPARVLDY